MLHTNVNMENVPNVGELRDRGAYLVRINEVKDTDDNGDQLLSKNSGGPICEFYCKIQDEGKWLGSQVKVTASLKENALFTLKAIYTAVGYKPGEEGHNPEECLDQEMYMFIDHKEYDDPNQGKRMVEEYPVWGFKSLTDGPAKPRSK